jgi:hypothetical protein
MLRATRPAAPALCRPLIFFPKPSGLGADVAIATSQRRHLLAVSTKGHWRLWDRQQKAHLFRAQPRQHLQRDASGVVLAEGQYPARLGLVVELAAKRD